ncbi:hypothetical protein DFJ74DRAFT_36808 [Hyaloraphidium curvatum]|nr:hypothetical protein DFJ74DRAFT_36808 [Hyaloraphidium curvatum]
MRRLLFALCAATVAALASAAPTAEAPIGNPDAPAELAYFRKACCECPVESTYWPAVCFGALNPGNAACQTQRARLPRHPARSRGLRPLHRGKQALRAVLAWLHPFVAPLLIPLFAFQVPGARFVLRGRRLHRRLADHGHPRLCHRPRRPSDGHSLLRHHPRGAGHRHSLQRRPARVTAHGNGRRRAAQRGTADRRPGRGRQHRGSHQHPHRPGHDGRQHAGRSRQFRGGCAPVQPRDGPHRELPARHGSLPACQLRRVDLRLPGHRLRGKLPGHVHVVRLSRGLRVWPARSGWRSVVLSIFVAVMYCSARKMRRRIGFGREAEAADAERCR